MIEPKQGRLLVRAKPDLNIDFLFYKDNFAKTNYVPAFQISYGLLDLVFAVVWCLQQLLYCYWYLFQ
jgi:hypothetical protein